MVNRTAAAANSHANNRIGNGRATLPVPHHPRTSRPLNLRRPVAPRMLPRSPGDARATVRHPELAPDGQPAARQVHVLIVQDHAMLASALARVVDAEPDLAVSGVSATGAGAVLAAAQKRPDVVLMDFRLPDVSGPEAARMIQSEHAHAAIVFHSADDSEAALLDAVDAGATAYLTQDATADQIIEAVRSASRGEVLIPVALFARAIARQRGAVVMKRGREQLLAEFTPRELEVLRLLAEGLDTTAMSMRLGIAPHTVEWHVRHVIEKLQVHSKLQAVLSAARIGLIEL
jgi:two-component system, NarL family, nitrate/nitrite response regulator NarL